MKKIIYIVVLAAFMFASHATYACRCAPPPENVTQTEYDEVSLVFVGIARNVTNRGAYKEVRFEVQDMLKGDPRVKEVMLYTPANGAMCGLDIKVGKQWYVWAYLQEDNAGKPIFGSNLCTRSLSVPEGIRANKRRYDKERTFLLQRRQSGSSSTSSGSRAVGAFDHLGKSPNLSLNKSLIIKSCVEDYGADVFPPETQGSYAEIRFENGIGDAMHIYGLDAEGYPKWEKTLRSGESYMQRTETGTPWIVTDFSGCLGVYAATQRNARTRVVAPQPANIVPIDCKAAQNAKRRIDTRKMAMPVFINESGRTLKLFHINDKGIKQFHSELHVGGFVEVASYVGNIWVVQDTAGNCLAAYEVKQVGQGYVTIGF